MNNEKNEDIFLKNRFKKGNVNVPKDIDDIIENTLLGLEEKSNNSKSGENIILEPKTKFNKKCFRNKWIKTSIAAALVFIIIGVSDNSFNVSAMIKKFFIPEEKLLTSEAKEYGYDIGKSVEKDGYKIFMKSIYGDNDTIKIVYEVEGGDINNLEMDEVGYIDGKKISVYSRGESMPIKIGDNKYSFVATISSKDNIPKVYKLKTALKNKDSGAKYEFNEKVDSSKLNEATKIALENKTVEMRDFTVVINNIRYNPIEIKSDITLIKKNEKVWDEMNSSADRNFKTRKNFSIKMMADDGSDIEGRFQGEGDPSTGKLNFTFTTNSFKKLPKTIECIPYIMNTDESMENSEFNIQDVKDKELVKGNHNFIVKDIKEEKDRFLVKVKANGLLIGYIANNIEFVGNNGGVALLSQESLLDLHQNSNKGEYVLSYLKNDEDKSYKLSIPKQLNDMYKDVEFSKINIPLK